MDVQNLQEIKISVEEIDAIYDQGRDVVKTLVFSLVDLINTSRNSNKSLSTDSPLYYKKKKSREFGNKQKRTGATMKQVENPNETILNKVEVCRHCLSDLSGVDP